MSNRILKHLDDPQSRRKRRVDQLCDHLNSLLADEAVVFYAPTDRVYCCCEHILPIADLDESAEEAAAWLRHLVDRIYEAAERLAEAGPGPASSATWTLGHQRWPVQLT